MPTRISKQPPPVVQEWGRSVRLSLKARRLANVATDDRVARLAGHLALIGAPTDPGSAEVFSGLVLLLFSYKRVQGIDKAIAALPADPVKLKHLAICAVAAGVVEPMDRASFSVEHFITTALQIPNPKEYIEVCKKENLTHIRGMFFPDTLKMIANRYRGVVGDLADQGHRDSVLSKIQTIR